MILVIAPPALPHPLTLLAEPIKEILSLSNWFSPQATSKFGPPTRDTTAAQTLLHRKYVSTVEAVSATGRVDLVSEANTSIQE